MIGTVAVTYFQTTQVLRSDSVFSQAFTSVLKVLRINFKPFDSRISLVFSLISIIKS